MKKWITLFACFSVLGGSGGLCQSQGDAAGTVLDILDPNATNTTLVFGRRYPEIQGSPYLLKDWSTGVIYREKGSPLEGVNLHYDMYAKELLVKEEDKVMTVIQDGVKGFKFYQLDGETLVFARKPQIEEKQFFQQLYKGQYELWKGYEIRVARQDNNAGGYGQAGNSSEIQRFSRKEQCFLFRPGESQPVVFNGTKKEFIALFSQEAPAIKAFLKKNKFKLAQDNEWAELMRFIDEGIEN